MKNVITSESGKKEAVIMQTMYNGYRVSVWQIVNNGLEVEKDFITSQDNFKSFETAKNWALKNISK